MAREGQGAHIGASELEINQMLYRERTAGFSLRKALLGFFLALFDRQQRRRRQVEIDLLSLSPHLRRDLGIPPRY